MLLKPEEIAARIKLYADLQDAYAELTNVANTIPEVCPSDFYVGSERLTEDGRTRIEFVMRRAWLALRKSVLADAQKKVDGCEEAVRKFEAGEDTNAPE